MFGRSILRSASRISSRTLPALAGKCGVQSHVAMGLRVQQHKRYSLSTQGENVDGKIDKLSDNEYSKISNEYLEALGDELEFLTEQFPQIDSELSQGVMTVSVPPNGTYVINKQPPNKQMWLSSPISGPKRYDLIGGRWITLRDNSGLTALLEEELSAALGQEVRFQEIEN